MQSSLQDPLQDGELDAHMVSMGSSASNPLWSATHERLTLKLDRKDKKKKQELVNIGGIEYLGDAADGFVPAIASDAKSMAVARADVRRQVVARAKALLHKRIPAKPRVFAVDDAQKELVMDSVKFGVVVVVAEAVASQGVPACKFVSKYDVSVM
jgi:hypothetical protein